MATVESVATTIDIDAILAPISEENPVGVSLQYDPVYSEIREARRADDASVSQGDWQTDLKTADYRQVVNLAVPALTSRSKDLQISVWLCEALSAQNGFVGLRDGIQLIRRLEETYWGNLFPEIDEGDMEARANAIGWLDTQLSLSIKKLPITAASNYSFISWDESTRFDFPENIESLEYEEQEKAKNLRAQAETEKRVTGEMWRTAKKSGNRAFYEGLYLSLTECKTELDALDRKNEELFDANQVPSLSNLRKSLEDIAFQINKIIEEKRLLEPDEIDETEERAISGEDGEAVFLVKGSAVASGVIQSRQDALKRLTDIAEYFSKNEPNSPLPSLIQRAVKWGNMPFDALVQDMIKNDEVVSQVRQTLGFNTSSDDVSS